MARASTKPKPKTSRKPKPKSQAGTSHKHSSRGLSFEALARYAAKRRGVTDLDDLDKMEAHFTKTIRRFPAHLQQWARVAAPLFYALAHSNPGGAPGRALEYLRRRGSRVSPELVAEAFWQQDPTPQEAWWMGAFCEAANYPNPDWPPTLLKISVPPEKLAECLEVWAKFASPRNAGKGWALFDEMDPV